MGGPHASAATAGSERRKERAARACDAGTLASWSLRGWPLAALALRPGLGLASLWLGRWARARVRFFKQKENYNRSKLNKNYT